MKDNVSEKRYEWKWEIKIIKNVFDKILNLSRLYVFSQISREDNKINPKPYQVKLLYRNDNEMDFFRYEYEKIIN